MSAPAATRLYLLFVVAYNNLLSVVCCTSWEFSKINLNAIRRTRMHDDGVFNDCQRSDQEYDDEIASVDSLTSTMDHGP